MIDAHKILVLLSCYNGEKYIAEQLKSILQQSGVVVSLLIRDDGSSDNTDSIVRDFIANNPQREITYINGQNIGCAGSFGVLLNKAFELKEQYDFFAFSDQDDVWMPEKLSVSASILNEMPEDKPCLYCSNLTVVDKDLNFIGYKNKKEQQPISKAKSLVESFATGCTMLLSKEVITFFHNNPPQTMILHDLWIFHLCAFWGEIYYDKNSYILYRQHGNNVVGAKVSFLSRLKSKFHTLKTIFHQHQAEEEALLLLNTYNDILSDRDKKLISIVALYRQRIIYWAILFFSPAPYHKMNRSGLLEFVSFKLKVLLRVI